MDNNKPQLIDLWRTSFDDSEEFIKLFFDGNSRTATDQPG